MALRYMNNGGGKVELKIRTEVGVSVRHVILTVGRAIENPLPIQGVGRRTGEVSSLAADSEISRKTLN